MNKLYRFFWDCGRMGQVNAIFVADEQEVKDAIGKHIYFGEILGKHSEVYGTLEEKDLRVLTDDQTFIKKFEELECESGYNPLDYLPEEEDEDDRDEDE